MKTSTKATKQERIEKLIALTVIERDGTGLYAVVPSLTSDQNYIIDINERTLELGKCQCLGAQHGCDACQHVVAVGVMVAASRIAVLNRVCAVYAHETVEATGESIESVVAEAEEAMQQEDEYDVIAEAVKVVERAEALPVDAYEVLAATKRVASAEMLPLCEGCCKLFQPSYEGQTFCGRC